MENDGKIQMSNTTQSNAKSILCLLLAQKNVQIALIRDHLPILHERTLRNQQRLVYDL